MSPKVRGLKSNPESEALMLKQQPTTNLERKKRNWVLYSKCVLFVFLLFLFFFGWGCVLCVYSSPSRVKWAYTDQIFALSYVLLAYQAIMVFDVKHAKQKYKHYSRDIVLKIIFSE